MLIEAPEDFPFPNAFVLTARAGAGGSDAVPVGVLVIKQTLQMDGTIGEQEPIVMADEAYVDETDTSQPPHLGHVHLQVRLESDLTPMKPLLDLVAIRDSFEPGIFGTARIDRGAGLGSAMTLAFGWRNSQEGARLGQAGDNLDAFEPVVIDSENPPPLSERFKLPENFNNLFFNGSLLVDVVAARPQLGLLHSSHRIQFDDGTVREVTIPPAAVVQVISDGRRVDPPVTIQSAVDTVVLDRSAPRWLLTRRYQFAWEDRLQDATLRISSPN